MASLWFATDDVLVSCETQEVCDTELWTNFPEFYKPTWDEYFNAIARQTKTHWYYKGEGYGFMFAAPAIPLPFTVRVADGWRVENYGYWVKYIPQQQPVGMDIYILGEYSVDEEGDEQALYERVRREWALAWARIIDPNCSLDQMKTVTVSDVDALFFKAKHPKTQIVVRQWILVKEGMCFGIFNVVEPGLEDRIRPDVQGMVASFDVRARSATTQAAGTGR